MINTTDALETMREILDASTDDPNISIVIVVANSKTSTVKVCGLNIDEMEVPILLTETAAEIGQRVLNDLENRTLN
jgi:hypothetical protein